MFEKLMFSTQCNSCNFLTFEVTLWVSVPHTSTVWMPLRNSNVIFYKVINMGVNFGTVATICFELFDSECRSAI